jgi:urease accessory protein
MKLRILLLAGFALLGAAAPAEAHVTDAMAGFAAGMVHPFLGLDHLFAIVAVGILGGLAHGHSVRALPGLFALTLAAGAFMGLGAPISDIIEPAISASVVVLGIAVMRPDILRAFSLIGIAVCFALGHGYAHGSEAPASGGPEFIAGMTATALVLALAASWFFRLPALASRAWYFGAICSLAGLVMLVPSL